MLFNSYAFLFVYLPVVFAGFYWLGARRPAWAAWWLGAASLVFYGVWDSRFLLLLLGSIACNYGMGNWLAWERQREDKTGNGRRTSLLLALAVGANLLLLGYYKYADFFLASAAGLLGQEWAPLGLVLPLGISFFTFTQIAYLVDVRRGLVREGNPAHYLLFVTYFPHLVAGPILHHKQMMPQFGLAPTYRLQPTHLAVGSSLFILGLAKKVLLADTFAEFATPVFAAAGEGALPASGEAWVGALAYTLQLYFDFSGYSDMAVGLSLLFNIRLPLNFYSPYRAGSIIEFWRRWHISLSTFLRDYLYIPLGGRQRGRFRRFANLFITMLLGGLWHGAAWTFVVWGGLHGAYLILNHGWRALRGRHGKAVSPPFWERLVGQALTFLAVVVAWVFFRADSLPAAGLMLQAMFPVLAISPDHASGAALAASAVDLGKARLLIAGGLLLVFCCPNLSQIFAPWRPTYDGPLPPPALAAGPHRWWQWRPHGAWALGLALLAVWSVFGFSRASEFLYFQF